MMSEFLENMLSEIGSQVLVRLERRASAIRVFAIEGTDARLLHRLDDDLTLVRAERASTKALGELAIDLVSLLYLRYQADERQITEVPGPAVPDEPAASTLEEPSPADAPAASTPPPLGGFPPLNTGHLAEDAMRIAMGGRRKGRAKSPAPAAAETASASVRRCIEPGCDHPAGRTSRCSLHWGLFLRERNALKRGAAASPVEPPPATTAIPATATATETGTVDGAAPACDDGNPCNGNCDGDRDGLTVGEIQASTGLSFAELKWCIRHGKIDQVPDSSPARYTAASVEALRRNVKTKKRAAKARE